LNHNEKNLNLLCPNCHSLTPTYGSLNKGNGRLKRRINRIKQENKLKLLSAGVAD
jgi:5-methylcytosine-specific restriction endonuclease McrA